MKDKYETDEKFSQHKRDLDCFEKEGVREKDSPSFRNRRYPESYPSSLMDDFMNSDTVAGFNTKDSFPTVPAGIFVTAEGSE